MFHRGNFQLVLISLLSFWAGGLFAQGRSDAVQSELISAQESVLPGESFWVGLKLSHAPGWHTYWKVTATGYATSLEWDLPEGVTAGEIQWPVPRPYEFEGFVEYVYEEEIILPVEIRLSEDYQGESLTLKVKADWLMCEKVCIPGGSEHEIELAVVRDSAPVDSYWKDTFNEILSKQLPKGYDSVHLEAERIGDSIELNISGVEIPERLYFFDEQTLIIPQLDYPIEKTSERSAVLRFQVDPAGVGEAERLIGVLRADPDWADLGAVKGVRVDVPLTVAQVPSMANNSASGELGLVTIIGLAFLGGLILNLMPCVFPVLGIKIMGFVEQAGQSRSKVAFHGLTFTLGVLVSFWILAILLVLLRSGGEELGWGFQLQYPPFVYLLGVFLFLFALNLTGLFEVGQSAVGLGSGLNQQSGLRGSFMSGVLATVVATPCAAPFLAPALGAALTLPPAASLVVFTSIGFGLSIPYLILSLFPQLVSYLPRPGAWMETFKQLMSFPLFATVAFLVWVLAAQLSEASGYSAFSFLNVLFSLVIIAIAGWIYGRWGAFHRPKTMRRVGISAAVVLFGVGLFAGYPTSQDASGNTVSWEVWEAGKPEKLAREGRIVYVDFTARWCVTCQTNKAAVFSSARVMEWIRENEVVLLKADWTDRNDEIARELQRWNRSAVPFNLVYLPEAPEEPKVLPELLTPSIVLEAFGAG